MGWNRVEWRGVAGRGVIVVARPRIGLDRIGMDRNGSQRIRPECAITMAVIKKPNRGSAMTMTMAMAMTMASLALTSKRKCLNLVTTTGPSSLLFFLCVLALPCLVYPGYTGKKYGYTFCLEIELVCKSISYFY